MNIKPSPGKHVYSRLGSLAILKDNFKEVYTLALVAQEPPNWNIETGYTHLFVPLSRSEILAELYTTAARENYARSISDFITLTYKRYSYEPAEDHRWSLTAHFIVTPEISAILEDEEDTQEKETLTELLCFAAECRPEYNGGAGRAYIEAPALGKIKDTRDNRPEWSVYQRGGMDY